MPEVTLEQGEVMFHLHHRQPLTKHELERLTGESAEKADAHLRSLYEKGLLVRRRRPHPSKRGKNPYEYMIHPDSEWEADDE